MQLVELGRTPKQFRPTKTVFVDNFFHSRANRTTSVQVVPHLGLMTLATILEDAGHEVAILDPKVVFARGGWQAPCPEFVERCAEDLLAHNADLIGFTAYGRTLPFVVRVARRIKAARASQKIALGGPHATITGVRILETFDCFDVVARYEAESVIVDLVSAVAAGSSLSHIPNLVFRHAGATVETERLTVLPEMDALPDPALHLYPLEELRLSELSIEAGRGCPYRCTFCSTANFFKRRYRLKSNGRIVREIEDARDRYGIRMFNLNHDLFGLVRKSLLEFCMLSSGRDFEWKCSMRTDTLDYEVVDALAESGCRHLYFGIETGSPRLQKRIEKRLDLGESRKMVAAVAAKGMHCTTSFITGFPDEMREDQDQTLDCIGELLAINPALVHPQLHVLSPEPGSDLSASSAEIAFDGVGPEVDELVDTELVGAHPDIFSVFYYYQSRVPRWRTVFASAFVTHLMPKLGYPLTTHLCTNYFDGSLSALFRAVAPDRPEWPCSFDEIVTILRQGLDRVVRGLSESAPHIQDLVRLSWILDTIRRQDTDAPPLNAGGPVAWLAHFDHDIQAMSQTIIADPRRSLSVRADDKAERWFLLKEIDGERLVIGGIDPRLGRELHDAGKTSWSLDRLGVSFVEC